MIDRNAVLAGTVVEVAALVSCAGLDVFRAIPWLGAVILVCLGVVGGAVAGGLVRGSKRRKAAHGGLSASFGGCFFAVWLWYTLVADVYLGAFYGLAYAIATSVPPAFAATYDASLPVAFGIACVFVYAIEGMCAGWLVPPEWIEPPPFYPSS